MVVVAATVSCTLDLPATEHEILWTLLWANPSPTLSAGVPGSFEFGFGGGSVLAGLRCQGRYTMGSGWIDLSSAGAPGVWQATARLGMSARIAPALPLYAIVTRRLFFPAGTSIRKRLVFPLRQRGDSRKRYLRPWLPDTQTSGSVPDPPLQSLALCWGKVAS